MYIVTETDCSLDRQGFKLDVLSLKYAKIIATNNQIDKRNMLIICNEHGRILTRKINGKWIDVK